MCYWGCLLGYVCGLCWFVIWGFDCCRCYSLVDVCLPEWLVGFSVGFMSSLVCGVAG